MISDESPKTAKLRQQHRKLIRQLADLPAAAVTIGQLMEAAKFFRNTDELNSVFEEDVQKALKKEVTAIRAFLNKIGR